MQSRNFSCRTILQGAASAAAVGALGYVARLQAAVHELSRQFSVGIGRLSPAVCSSHQPTTKSKTSAISTLHGARQTLHQVCHAHVVCSLVRCDLGSLGTTFHPRWRRY